MPGRKRVIRNPGRRGAVEVVRMTKAVRPAKLKDGTKVAVLKLMRTMIGKEAENKRRGFIIEQNVLHNAPISDADVVPLLGSIPEGTGSLERLGDRVKPKSFNVRGVIGLNPDYNPNNKPMIATVMILACKDKKTNALVTAGAGTADLLKPNIGGTEQVPWDGTTVRSTYPINTEKFKLFYVKQFRIAPGSLAGGTREYDYVKWKYSFKDMPASLTWDEGTGDDCNNFAPFVVVGWCYTDGSAPDVVPRLISNISSQISYEDA